MHADASVHPNPSKQPPTSTSTATPKGSDKITSERQISSLEELNVIVVRISLLGAIVLPVNVNPKTVLEEVDTWNPAFSDVPPDAPDISIPSIPN